MRFVIKVSIPVQEGNAGARTGFKQIQTILADQKPEAVYFYADNGKRTGLQILDLKEPSQIPGIAEPWFLAFGASIDFYPAMTPEDLAKAGPSIEDAVKKYG